MTHLLLTGADFPPAALCAQDGNGEVKMDRESYFPSSVLDRAMTFHCAEGEASVQADRERILTAIQMGPGGHARVDNTVRGIVAAGSLQRGLLAGEESRSRYLAALRAGKIKKLAFPAHKDLTVERLTEVCLETRHRSQRTPLIQQRPNQTQTSHS